MSIGDSPGIVCPKCGGAEQEVRDSRASLEYIRRRRLCKTCNARFTTLEMIATDEGHAFRRAVAAARNLAALSPERAALVQRLIAELAADPEATS